MVWAVAFGDAADDDIAYEIIVDSLGDVIVTGSFQGIVDFDPDTSTFNLTSNGVNDVFVLKLNSDGEFRWVHQAGGSLDDIAYSLSIDPAQNIYVTGSFHDTALFNLGFPPIYKYSMGQEDIFIMKLDTSGNLIWVHGIGNVNEDVGYSVVADDYGHLYITGYFHNFVDFDPSGNSMYAFNSQGQEDVFILKLDTAGNFHWAKRVGGNFMDTGNDLAINDSGLYIVGFFCNNVDFNPDTSGTAFLTASSGDAFLLKLDTSGAFMWARDMGGGQQDYAMGVALDKYGDIYSTGWYQGTASFDTSGGNILTTNGVQDIFLQKHNSNGDLLWVHGMGNVNDDRGWDVETDNDGYVYSTGFYQNIVDFDPGANSVLQLSQGAEDIFVLKWNTNTYGPCDSAEWAIWVEHPACEEDTGCAGEIGLWIDMGNPPYRAYLYDYNSGTYSDTLTYSGSGPGYFEFYRCEGTYEGYLLDSNGCTFSLTVVVGTINSAIQQGDTVTICKGDSILLSTQEPCQSLLAYFPLDSNTNDESGYGNNGTAYNSYSYVDDRFGNPNSAILFDGFDGYLEIPDTPHYNLGNEEFSISYWVMRKDSVNGNGTLLGNPSIYDNVFEVSKFHVNSLSSYGSSEWVLGVGNDLNGSVLNKPSFLIESATAMYTVSGTTHLTDYINTWSFMTGVREGDSLKIYYNGTLENSTFIGTDSVNC